MYCFMDDKENGIEELIEEIQETQNPEKVKEFCLLMGFLLHEKEAIHFILLLILNLVSSFILASIFKNSLVIFDSLLYFGLCICVLTIFEFFIKKIIIAKFPLVMLYTAGQIFTLWTFIILGLLCLILPGFEFVNFGFFLIFTLVFCILRMIISVATRRILALIIIGKGE